jgi:hypothetical protein
MNKQLLIGLIVASSFALSACGAKKTTTTISPTPATKMIEMQAKDRPYISLIPRADGHELKLKIDNIPSSITQIEYEMLYSAKDNNLEIEKGVGDTIKVDNRNLFRDLLLGTASCTNGCKYKYDEGIDSGTLSLTFINNKGESTVFETPFALKSAADFKKDGQIALPIENVIIKSSPAGKDFYILMKNFGLPQGVTEAKATYSLFSSGTSTAKVTSTTPEALIKNDKTTFVGDYILK